MLIILLIQIMLLPISNNTITDYPRGILALNIKNTNTNGVYDNTITLTRSPDQLPTNYRAIKLVNCRIFNVENNTVTWSANDKASDYKDLVQGTALEATTHGNIIENYFDKLGAAIRTKEDCSKVSLLCNTMKLCNTGVYLDNNGVANNKESNLSKKPP